MDANQILDNLLNYIRDNSQDKFWESFSMSSYNEFLKYIYEDKPDLGGFEDPENFPTKTSGPEIQMMLQKLVNDGYLSFTGSEYKLTWEGRCFEGYVKQEQRQSKTSTLQTLAIWVTAIGTGLGGLYVIGKFLLWLCGC